MYRVETFNSDIPYLLFVKEIRKNDKVVSTLARDYFFSTVSAILVTVLSPTLTSQP